MISEECDRCHHSRNEHVFDEKEDYEYCLKCTCNRYTVN